MHMFFHDNGFSFIIQNIFYESKGISYLNSLIRNNDSDYVIGREHNPYWHQTSNHIH